MPDAGGDDIVVRIVGVDDGLTDKLNKSTASLDALRDAMRGATSDGKTAEAAAAAWGARLSATAAVTQTAAAEAKTMGEVLKGTTFNVGMATREFRALFDELSSGRTRMVPGTLAIIANRVFGLQGATLLGAGAVAGLAAGLAYMAYENIQAENALRKLTEAFALTGRGADFTTEAVRHNIDVIAQIPGSTKAAAEAYMGLVAQHANISYVLSNQVGQLMPMFIDQLGKKAPEGAAKLAETLASLSVAGFQKLDRDMLNLAPAQYAVIENLIRTGQTGEATKEILEQLGTNSGVHIKSLGDQIFDLQEKMKKMYAVMDEGERRGHGDTVLVQKYHAAVVELEKLIGLQKEAGVQERNNQLKDEYDLAVKINSELDRKAQIELNIKKLEALASNSKPGSEASRAAYAAIANEEHKLSQIEKTEDDKRYRIFVDTEQAKVAESKQGSGARIKVAEEEAAEARRVFGEMSTEYQQAMINLGNQRRAASTEAKRIQDEENRKFFTSLTEAQAEFKRVRQDDLRTDLEISQYRLQGKKQELEQEVAEGKITNAKKIDMLKEYTRQEFDAQIAFLQADSQIDSLSLSEKNSYYNKIKALRAKLNVDLATLDKQRVNNENKELDRETMLWRGAENTILRGETMLVQGIFGGRQNLWQALGRGVLQMAQQEIQADLHALTHHLMSNNTKLASDKVTEEGGFLWHLFFSDAKTDAEIAADAQRMSTEAANAVASKAIEIPKNVSTIMGDAAVAGAGAYAATAAIPIVGPALAPAAAGTAYAATAAFASLTVAEKGQWNTGQGGMYMLHPQESVMPANIANPMRDFFKGGGANGGGDHFHITVHATDAGSVRQLFMNNGKALVSSLTKQKRNLDPFFSQGRT